MPVSELLRISAAMSRGAFERQSIASLDRGEADLAELYESFAWMTSLVETELELGIAGDVELPSKII